MITEMAAWIAVILFFGLMCFQVLLALGFPYGQAAWGGKYIKLPNRLRIASLVSAAIFVVTSLFVLEKAEIISVFNNSTVVTVGVWILIAFFGLNTLGNLVTKSKQEKRIMTPISVALVLLCLIVAITAS
jgi:hypothetical protein